MSFSQTARVGEKVPVIDVTDLYYPAQDFGDNFDIIVPYAHPGVDLRAVILDVTDRFRRRVSKHLEFTDDRGPREPGFVPIRQLNYIFKVDTPHAMGPRQEMVDAADTMSGLNGFDAAGVDLILRTLRESDTPVEVLVFGSARSVAVAMNRASGLFAEKVGRIHLSAGASDPEYLEWNASLDPTAIDTLFAGPTPLTLYPCATGGGPFDLGVRNTYWRIDSLDFIRRMRAPLRNYLIDGLRASAHNDYLAAMDEEDEPADAARLCDVSHNVWETAVWMNVLGIGLRRGEAGWRIGRPATAEDWLVTGRTERATARIDARGHMTLGAGGRQVDVYVRDDPMRQQAALQEALPALYLGF